MPELPEVETVVTDLRSALTGRRIERATVARGSVIRFPDADAFVARTRGARVTGVTRRGKYIVVDLWSEELPTPSTAAPPPVGELRDSGPEGDEQLVVHLGMTGHLDICDADAPPRPHTHLRLHLDDGRELRFADARRFGRVLLGVMADLETARAIPRLGVEPLSRDFTPEALDLALRSTRRTLKAALLDQTRVAGLGNIYVDEACFRAGVRPQRRCHRTTRAERRRLHAAIVATLEQAVRNRGSSIDDYRDAYDRPGTHQEELLVYGRAGQPCVRCGIALRRTVLGGRGTVSCPRCQR